MSDPIAPMTPADCDLRTLPYMPLDVVRLRDSGLSMTATGEEFRTAVLLWCAAWHQVPAASLPDDDAALAQLAGFGRSVKEFKKVKTGALRGWVKCSDGRFYHPVVSEKANAAWAERIKYRERKRQQRTGTVRGQSRDVPETSPGQGQRQDTGQTRDGVETTPLREEKGREEKRSSIAAAALSPRDKTDLIDRPHELIAAFHDAIERHYGRELRPAFAAGGDVDEARAWLAAGHDPARIVARIDAMVAASKAKGRKQPGSLRYFTGALNDPMPKVPTPTHDASSSVLETLGGESVYSIACRRSLQRGDIADQDALGAATRETRDEIALAYLNRIGEPPLLRKGAA
jgi:hypothetical protein